MKLYILSDIHGDSLALEKLVDYFLTQDFDNIIILGDICHGYGSSNEISVNKIGNILSRVVTRLILVRGNCDLVEDVKYLPTGFRDTFSLMLKGKNIYFAHGHRYFPYGILNENDIYCHGHSHMNMIEKVNNKFIECNPGSISMPRGNTKKSYMEINDSSLIIYDLDHNIIKQTQV